MTIHDGKYEQLVCILHGKVWTWVQPISDIWEEKAEEINLNIHHNKFSNALQIIGELAWIEVNRFLFQIVLYCASGSLASVGAEDLKPKKQIINYVVLCGECCWCRHYDLCKRIYCWMITYSNLLNVCYITFVKTYIYIQQVTHIHIHEPRLDTWHSSSKS